MTAGTGDSADVLGVPAVRRNQPSGLRQLLLLHRSRSAGRSIARSLEAIYPIETRALGAQAPAAASPPDLVIIGGLNPDSPERQAQIRRIITPFLRTETPVLWILDSPSLRHEMEARALGARTVLPAAAPPDLLIQAIGDLSGLDPAERQAQRRVLVKAVVQEVSGIIGRLVEAAAPGEAPAALAGAAARLLLDTLDVAETGRWMEIVSVIHEPTFRHSVLMAGIAAAFALSLDLGAEDSRQLVRAGVLHDVGKTMIPVEIMNKPGHLTPAEMTVVRKHPEWGYELLRAHGDQDPAVLAVVRHHHEFLDGTGYPHGLKGEQINKTVRIATICDIFTALIEKRAYKPGFSADAAFALMTPMQGKLDPILLSRFKYLFVESRPRRPDVPAILNPGAW